MSDGIGYSSIAVVEGAIVEEGTPARPWLKSSWPWSARTWSWAA